MAREREQPPVHAFSCQGAAQSCGRCGRARSTSTAKTPSIHLSAANLKELPRPKEHRDAAQGHRGHSAQGEHLSSPVLMGRALLLHKGTISKQHNFAILISDCGWGLV